MIFWANVFHFQIERLSCIANLLPSDQTYKQTDKNILTPEEGKASFEEPLVVLAFTFFGLFYLSFSGVSGG